MNSILAHACSQLDYRDQNDLYPLKHDDIKDAVYDTDATHVACIVMLEHLLLRLVRNPLDIANNGGNLQIIVPVSS